MKFIEVSRRINLSRPVPSSDLKRALLDRLEKSIEITHVGDANDRFNIQGTTGNPTGWTRHARIDFTVDMVTDDKTARVVISGFASMARSLVVAYVLAFFLLLLSGLLPGSINTAYDTSDSGDMLVLLILGIYIVYDVHRKLNETREFLTSALDSMETLYN